MFIKRLTISVNWGENMITNVYKVLVESLMVVEHLDRKTIKIIMYLYEREGAYISHIASDLKMSNTTVYNALLTLLQIGLILETRKRGGRFIVLTEKGRLVAEKLYEIENILSKKSL